MRRCGLLAAALRGAWAGAAGTAAMDLFWRVREPPRHAPEPRRSGPYVPASRAWSGGASAGDGDVLPLRGASGVWVAAPAPAQVGRRVYEGMTQRDLEVRFARLVGAAVHWGYGMLWGSVLGTVAVRAHGARLGWGPAFAVAVWGTSYLLLPVTGLYRPVWEYRVPELLPDLIAHLVYGTGTASALALMDRLGSCSRCAAEPA